MRNLVLSLLCCIFSIGWGQQKDIIGTQQCVISGPSTFNVGQTVAYSVPNLAQCSNCYDWDIVSGNSNVQIVGSDMNQNLQLLGVNSGSFQLRLTYFDENGCHECYLNGNSINAPTCCEPRTKGNLECRPNGSGHGFFSFLDSNTCNLDWSTISSINVTLLGATFVGTGLNTRTFNNPTGPIDFTFSAPVCNESSYVRVNYTVNYNNGCEAISGEVRLYPGVTHGKIEVYPNPTDNIINFKGNNIESLNLSIIDLNGNIVLKSRLAKQVDISKLKSGKYHYMIYKDNVKIDEGSILKK